MHESERWRNRSALGAPLPAPMPPVPGARGRRGRVHTRRMALAPSLTPMRSRRRYAVLNSRALLSTHPQTVDRHECEEHRDSWGDTTLLPQDGHWRTLSLTWFVETKEGRLPFLTQMPINNPINNPHKPCYGSFICTTIAGFLGPW